MKFSPLGDRVLIRPLQKQEVSKGGIIIPTSARDKDPLAKGIVEAVGLKVQSDLEAGDTVIFSSTAGSTVTSDGEELLVMSEDSIHAIVNA